MRFIVKDGVAWFVTVVSPAKTAEPIEMPSGLRTWLGPRDHVLDGGSVRGENGRPIVKYRDFLPCSVQIG